MLQLLGDSVGPESRPHLINESTEALALAGVAQLAECCPMQQRVAGSLPSQAHDRLWAQSLMGVVQEADNRCFALTSMFPPTPLPVSLKIYFKIFKK